MALRRRQSPIAVNWGWGLWAAVLLIGSTLSMSLLIDTDAWMIWLIMMMVSLPMVSVLGQRLIARWDPVWQTITIALVLLGITLVIANRQVAASEMIMGLVPTISSMTAVGDQLLQALALLITAEPPVPEIGVFAPLLFIAYGILAVVVVTSAVIWKQPALMIITSIAPWMAVFSMRVDPPAGLPIGNGLVILLFALWSGVQAQPVRDSVSSKRNWRGPLATMILTGATVLALLAGIVGPSIPHWGSGLDWLRSLSQGEGQTIANQNMAGIGVAGDFDLNGQLQSGHVKSLMIINGTYQGPLMVGTVTDFDGRSWVAASSSVQDSVSDGKTIWPSSQPVSQKVFKSTTSATIRFLTTSSNVIPLGTGPRVIQSDWPTMTYKPLTDQLLAPIGVDGSQITQSVRLLDRSTLPGDFAGTPPGQNPGLFLYVPGTSHSADVASLASQLTNGITGDYNKLMAIQSYLKSSGFTYTLRPMTDQTTDDAVWDFLQRRTGYCVHFATAMIILGRLAGIPMRGAVGYITPSGGSGTITSHSAHMWPQAYFRDAGWVDFDPTPSGGPGAVPSQSSASAPTASQSSSDTPDSTVPPPESSSSDSSDIATPSSSPSTEQDSGHANGVFPWFGGLLGVLVLLGGAVVAVQARRIRRYSPEQAWAAIVRAANHRGTVDVSATPRTVAWIVGVKLDDETRDRLHDLAGVIEHRHYGPPGDGKSEQSPRYWYQLQMDVIKQLRHRHAA